MCACTFERSSEIILWDDFERRSWRTRHVPKRSRCSLQPLREGMATRASGEWTHSPPNCARKDRPGSDGAFDGPRGKRRAYCLGPSKRRNSPRLPGEQERGTALGEFERASSCIRPHHSCLKWENSKRSDRRLNSMAPAFRSQTSFPETMFGNEVLGSKQECAVLVWEQKVGHSAGEKCAISGWTAHQKATRIPQRKDRGLER